MLDRAILEKRGWAAFALSANGEQRMLEELLEHGATLGVPTPSRSGADVCDVLSPIEAGQARARSLSRTHSLGEFPLHFDTAHWTTPCRYIILACISSGRGERATLLLDARRIELNARQLSLLESTPLRVTNGRSSFFSTVLSRGRSFVRFDPGCMTPATPDGHEALDVLARSHWEGQVEQFRWEARAVLVIDNWRVLHGRGDAKAEDPDRKLMRITIR